MKAVMEVEIANVGFNVDLCRTCHAKVVGTVREFCGIKED